MSPIIFNTDGIYNRGLFDPNLLSADERFVYLLTEVDIYSAMEGWDSFFRSPVTGKYYAELKTGLLRVGADPSLAILEAYEQEVIGLGFAMTAEGINDMLSSSMFANAQPHHDFYESWLNHSTDLWETVRCYLALKGATLIMHWEPRQNSTKDVIMESESLFNSNSL